MNKKLKIFRKAAALIAALLMLFCMTPQAAFAYSSVNTNAPVSLTIQYKDGDTAISGAKFSLYRVADISSLAYYTPTENFTEDKTNVSLSTTTVTGSDDWQGRALALEGYISLNVDTITPDLTGTTDSSGKLVFATGSGITQGLYLMLGTAASVGRVTYTPTPVFVSLPYLETTGDNGETWNYTPQISPKYEKKSTSGGGGGGGGTTPGDDTKDLTIVKVWEDDDDAQGVRADSVEVVLMNGTAEYARVTLSAENSWRYTCEDVPENGEWSVVETNTPDGYTYAVARESNTFIITNTLKAQDTPDNPDDPDNPGDNDDPDNPSTPGGTNGTTTPGSSGGTTTTGTTAQKLPQTGQLWWPVSFLAGGGIVLLLVGYRLRRKNTPHHNGRA